MAVNLSPVAGAAAQFFDNSGNVLTGGKLYTYSAGTTTPAVTYTSNSGITAQPNPIILDAAGRVPDSGEIWLSDSVSYKFVLKDQNDVLIGTYDNLVGINSNFVNFTSEEETQTATQGQTVFTLATIQYIPATNNLLVFVNGSKQIIGDNYIETSSTVITFVDGLNVGDVVDFCTAVPINSNTTTASSVTFTGFKGQEGNVQNLADDDGSDWIGFIADDAEAVARSAQDKMQDIVSIEDFGADGTENGDSAAIKAAIAYASTNWLPVMLPARRIYWDGTPITEDKVRLWGDGKPSVNAGKTTLIGGTIIEGKLTFTGSYIDLRDFGVDLGTDGSAADGDGIKCTSATYDAGVSLHVENLIALCKAKTSAVHALLFEGYGSVSGGNLTGINGYYGCVIKCQNVQLSSISTDTQNDAGVYLKSDNTYGTCANIQIDEIFTKDADNFGVRVQSDGAALDKVQIGKVSSINHDRTICVQVVGATGVFVSNVHFDSIISENSGIADFSVLSQKSGGAVFNAGYSSLISINPTAKVFESQCESGASSNHLYGMQTYASYALGTTQSVMNDAFSIATGVNSTEFNNVEIVEGYGVGSKIGGMNYQFASSENAHILGSHQAIVYGGGRPTPGNYDQTLSGLTATMSIADNYAGYGTSFCKVTIAANATITIFAPLQTNATFAPGHVVYVLNNSVYTLTVNYNVAGFIINTGGLNVALASNEVAAWISDGTYWHQLK